VIHLKLKYNSIQVAIATTRIRLRMLPIPRYISKRKNVRAIVIMIPRRELAKIKEKVKRRQKNIKTKNRGIVPKDPGSMK
jgi:hypothetical protein